MTGSFNDLSSPFDAAVAGGSHIHSAWPGQNGGVNIILDANTATNNLSGMYMANSNMYTLSSGAIDTLMMRMNYVNIHTSAFGGGELRGQIVPLANSYLFTNLAPIHTMPVVNTNARGALMVERVQNNIMLYGTFEGLESKVATAIAGGAHIHLGDVTTSGGVEFILNPAFAIDTMSASYDAMENSFSLTETQVSNLLMGDNYVNIHTINNQGGELRGQFLSDYNNAPDMNTISAPMNAATVNIDTNAFAQIEVMWSMADDQNGNTVAYVWQLAADSNFTMPILAMAMGAEMSFTATHNMIDSVLGANGIAYGDTAMLYHRVIATDGSLESMSQSYTVNFVRTGVLSVSEIQDYELSVYPNPSSETVYIKWNGNASKIESIQIIDVSGRLVSSQNRLNNSNGLTTIDVGAFKSGLYFVSLVQENGSTKTSSLVVK